MQGRDVWKSGVHYDPYVVGQEPTNEVWWLGRVYRAQNSATTGPTPPTHTAGTIYDGGGTAGVGWLYVAPASVVPPTSPTPHSANVLIEGNIISRSRLPGTDFAMYGVGPWNGFARTYPNNEIVDVAVEEIRPDEGIAVSGSARNVTVRGNQIRNCAVAILFYGRKLPIPFSLLDVTVERNSLSDFSSAGIRFTDYTNGSGGSAITYPQRVSILGNQVDGDPFQWNAARNPGGKWKSNASTGIFVDTNKVPGLVIAGNHVRNVALLVAGINDAKPTMEGNVGYCDVPASGTLGYNVDNVGIGTLIAPQLGWRYAIEDGNPTSATYGQILNPCPLAVAAVTQTTSTTPPMTFYTPPTGFKWVEGTIVANTILTLVPATGTTRYWVSGWRRVSTGTGDDLNTNWLELRTPVNGS